MKILGFSIFEKPQATTPGTALVRYKDATPSIRPDVELIVPEPKKPANIRPVKSVALTYNTKNAGRGNFEPSDWDMNIIGKAEDVDSFIAQAFLKKIGLMFKEGYELVGANPRTINYVKLRLAQISRATGIPTDELFRSIGAGLIKKSNAFLIKARNEDASGGKIRTLPGTDKEIKPVAGYFLAPAESMRVRTDEHGKILEWKQEMPDGYYKIFKPQDVCHFSFNKKEGFTFGTPVTVPVMDDIRALRKIEENIELLIYQHIFPLFHYKIGSDLMPAGVDELGRDEIDVAQNEIRFMPTEGGIVTSHRHEIQMIGAESKALRAETYLDHFKKRVFAGLAVSAVDMGEGECYSEDTETLTENGWKLHWAINHSKEKIATFNPETNQLEFHIANYKHESRYVGPLIHIEAPGIDISVTPHHDMWVAKPAKELVWEKVHAMDLPKYSSSVYMADHAPYRGSAYPINKIEFLERDAVKSIDMNTFAKLLACFMRFGSVEGQIAYLNESSGYGNSYATLKELAQVLMAAGIPIKASWNKKKALIIDNQALVEILSKYSNDISYVLNTFSMNAMATLVNEFMELAGTERKKNHWCFVHEDKEFINKLHALFVASGNRTTISSTGNQFLLHVYKNSKPYKSINTKKHISQVFYSGTIYCYNVPNHLFVTRRNGKVAIQGNTANRATADNMSRNMVDSVKDYQRVFECQVTEQIIDELLLESTFGPDVLDEKNRVRVKFREIDLEAQIKKEAHYADQFNKGIMTQDEARKKGSGLEPILIPTAKEMESMDEDALRLKYPEYYKTFWKMFKEPEMLIVATDEPYSAAAKAAAKNPALSVSPGDQEEAAEEQKTHEVELEKEKGKAKIAIAKLKPKPKAKDSFLAKHYKDLEIDLVNELERGNFDKDWFNQLSRIVATEMSNKLKTSMVSAFISGYRSVNSNSGMGVNALTRKRGQLESHANFYVEKLLRQLRSAVNRQIAGEINSDTIVKAKAIFDALRFRNDFIEESEIDRARNLGILTAGRDLGFKKYMSVSKVNSCDVCRLNSHKEVEISSVSFDEINPHHPGCDCKIRLLEE